MNRIVTDKAAWSIAEVYATDIRQLKDSFNEWNGRPQDTSVGTSFGIPFLQLKNNTKPIAFASLIVNENGEIGYKIYQKSSENPKIQTEWEQQVAMEFLEKRVAFKDAASLQSGILCLLNWLDYSCN
ncbi:MULTISPECIES: hypothetical protein [unclassified Flavobacterium]|uniref:hypothetical protein n=1 Tax=unclassified Flavobacterium TaxID=196869 RepID=UPI00263A0293|nr:hypothetical protein [Flavobacterium sp.]